MRLAPTFWNPFRCTREGLHLTVELLRNFGGKVHVFTAVRTFMRCISDGTGVVLAGWLACRCSQGCVTGKLGPSQTGKYDHEHVYVRAIVLDNGAARAALISVESGSGNADATLKAIGQELNCPARM